MKKLLFTIAALVVSNQMAWAGPTVHLLNKSKHHTFTYGISGENTPTSWAKLEPGTNADVPVPANIGPDPEGEGPKLWYHAQGSDSGIQVDPKKDTWVVLIYKNNMWVPYQGSSLKECYDTYREEKKAGQ